MKRCFKCVSNQKCSTGNLQSLWGRCEMCSPCHFCYDRSTLHAPRCQIPPPSHYCSSNALDSSVRKSRETLVPWPASGQLPDHGRDSETKRQFTFITKEKTLDLWARNVQGKLWLGSETECQLKEGKQKGRNIKAAGMNNLQRSKSWYCDGLRGSSLL